MKDKGMKHGFKSKIWGFVFMQRESRGENLYLNNKSMPA